jgi:hypothetical protein
MKLDTFMSKGFEELEKEADALQRGRTTRRGVTRFNGEPIFIVPHAEFKGWGTRVLNLLQRGFGEESIHFKEFTKTFSRSSGEVDEFETCRAILLSAKKDFEGGFLFSVSALVKAEVLDDVLEQAATLLDAGYKDAACILTGVTLETTLKELSKRANTQLGKLDKMNADLCKAGVYNMAKQKQITAWAELRNKAAHGEWTVYDVNDVKSFHEGVQRLVADYL